MDSQIWYLRAGFALYLLQITFSPCMVRVYYKMTANLKLIYMVKHKWRGKGLNNDTIYKIFLSYMTNKHYISNETNITIFQICLMSLVSIQYCENIATVSLFVKIYSISTQNKQISSIHLIKNIMNQQN